jgi:hypothetical protein
VLVQAEADQRGGEDHASERKQRDARGQLRPRAPAHDQVEADHQHPGQHGHRDQLEEPPPRVVGVRHAGDRERVPPAEQVGQLEHDERREQRVDRDEDRGGLGRAQWAAAAQEVGGARRAEGSGRRLRRRGRTRDQQRQVAGGQREQAGRGPGDQEHDDGAAREVFEVDRDRQVERAPGQTREDGVGGGEQEGEHEDDRGRDQQPAIHRQPWPQAVADRPSVVVGWRWIGAWPRPLRPNHGDRPGDRRRDDRSGGVEHPGHEAARDPRAGERGNRAARQRRRDQEVGLHQPRIGTEHRHGGEPDRPDRQPGVGGVGAAQAVAAGRHAGGPEERDHDQHGVQAGLVAGHRDVDHDAHADGEEQDAAGGDSGHSGPPGDGQAGRRPERRRARGAVCGAVKGTAARRCPDSGQAACRRPRHATMGR